MNTTATFKHNCCPHWIYTENMKNTTINKFANIQHTLTSQPNIPTTMFKNRRTERRTGESEKTHTTCGTELRRFYTEPKSVDTFVPKPAGPATFRTLARQACALWFDAVAPAANNDNRRAPQTNASQTPTAANKTQRMGCVFFSFICTI